MQQVILPWPPRELSPNARVHWAKKAAAGKRYRLACWALCKEVKLSVPKPGRIHLEIEFVKPSRRRGDMDNMLASIKSGLDGMALALGVDDSRFTLGLSVSEGVGGMVRVTVAQ